MSAIERITDKVNDVEVLTKSCRSCIIWSNKQNDPSFPIWKATHVCLINHEGSPSSMESNGAVKSFQRSIGKHGVRYVNYIGDGDPYPDKTINKLECIGHIQKRVGTNLIRLTHKNKFMKGKGEGRLTKKVIAAVLCHCVRKVDENGVEDKADRHKYWPKTADTWCKYQKGIMEGTEFKGDRINIAGEVYEKIRLRLSENDLLEKCLHGRTQNVNEAFNALVWQRCPKQFMLERLCLKFQKPQ